MKKRKKAFLGAAIGAITTIGSTLINNAQQKKAAELQEEQLKETTDLQNKNNTYVSANNLSSAYNNQDYVDSYNKKVRLKYGGKRKTPKYSDRTSSYKMGGKSKSKGC